MTRLEQQMQTREANARLLDTLLADVDGIRVLPRDLRVTRHAHHGYIFRVQPEAINHIDKPEFVRRVRAEGIPVLAGYNPLNRNEAIIRSIRQWSGTERVDDCPVCERMCEKEAVWLTPNMMLGDEQAMHDVAAALQKVIKAG